MIASFADDGLEELWQGKKTARARRIPADIRQRVLDRMTAMEVAASINDLRVPPSNRLEQLQGDLAGHWSIRVNDQWRLVFKWQEGAAGPSEISLRDYH